MFVLNYLQKTEQWRIVFIERIEDGHIKNKLLIMVEAEEHRRYNGYKGSDESVLLTGAAQIGDYEIGAVKKEEGGNSLIKLIILSTCWLCNNYMM